MVAAGLRACSRTPEQRHRCIPLAVPCNEHTLLSLVTLTPPSLSNGGGRFARVLAESYPRFWALLSLLNGGVTLLSLSRDSAVPLANLTPPFRFATVLPESYPRFRVLGRECFPGASFVFLTLEPRV